MKSESEKKVEYFARAAAHLLPVGQIRAAHVEYSEMLLKMIRDGRVWTPDTVRKLAPIMIDLVAEAEESAVASGDADAIATPAVRLNQAVQRMVATFPPGSRFADVVLTLTAVLQAATEESGMNCEDDDLQAFGQLARAFATIERLRHYLPSFVYNDIAETMQTCYDRSNWQSDPEMIEIITPLVLAKAANFQKAEV